MVNKGKNTQPEPKPILNQRPTISSTARLLWANRKKTLLAFFLGVSLTNAYVNYRREKKLRTIQPKTILVWNLADGITEAPMTGSGRIVGITRLIRDPGSLLGAKEAAIGGPITILQFLRTLKMAEDDDRVTGVIADLTTPHDVPGWWCNLGLGQVQELRSAILSLRQKKLAEGKECRLVAHANTLDRQLLYYLGTAFDKVYISPAGSLGLVGLSASVPLFKKLLDRLGVQIFAETREQYKGVTAMVTHQELPEPIRRNMATLLCGMNGEMVADICEARMGHLKKMSFPSAASNEVRHINCECSLERDEIVLNMMRVGPLSAREAEESGLIDGRLYKHQVIAEMFQKPSESPDKLMPPADPFLRLHPNGSSEHYLPAMALDFYGKNRDLEKEPSWWKAALGLRKHPLAKLSVAMIYCLGAISDGGGPSPTQGGTSTTAARAIITAARDPRIDAIVVRVDSPGGEVVASDHIADAIRYARKEMEKPVVISFGNQAASGGYMIGVEGDRIYTNPSTITGSIGVAAVKISLEEALKRIDVNVEELYTGSRFNSVKSPTRQELDRFRSHVDEAYEMFLGAVSKARGMEQEYVRTNFAGGRVFTGSDAVQYGLADGIGGTLVAVMSAAELGLEAITRKKDRMIEQLEKSARERRSLASEIALERARVLDRVLPHHVDLDTVEIRVFPEPRPLGQLVYEALTSADLAMLTDLIHNYARDTMLCAVQTVLYSMNPAELTRMLGECSSFRETDIRLEEESLRVC